MCIIAVSPAGIRQPDTAALRHMFDNNPHGAGYMVARNGRVEISKGYMRWEDFSRAITREAFTAADPVVYHFRISTQAGVNPEMTHPFPLTAFLEKTKILDCTCPIGVAHNGIIQLTSDRRDKEYSDTAHYIAEFLRYLVRTPEDLRKDAILDAIRRTTKSKWALMDGNGYIATVGDFIEEDGVLFSNSTFRAHERRTAFKCKNYTPIRSFFEDDPYADEDDPYADDLAYWR